MGIGVPIGLPGAKTARTAEHRVVLRQGEFTDLSKPLILDGSLARDSGNTGNLDVLRAGLLLGKITTGGKYAPSILGVMTVLQSATDTTVTVSAAQATEIVRRVGATGTLRFVGPPSAAGTVAEFTETYSAVDTTTGIITVSSLNADLIAGSFICANDGSAFPRTFVVEDGHYDWSWKVTDQDGTSVDIPVRAVPTAGVIESAKILPVWPSDTSLQSWVTGHLNGEYINATLGKGLGRGKFVFDHAY